ncbi:hypothetical protein BDF20DRAFT_901537 [Mycotypha africana]|uniref:uncharacterized protein n=1 Tax=Mycotypha africana TaxID=64632 RepID=UPI0022FFF561|nr:uncharacterized protein BDF20DRAFT_901537 [Mycotypha africana]KAI8967269.1 hypothetical protein BDF20DRAFT_901537 [Mycotypha africana]
MLAIHNSVFHVCVCFAPFFLLLLLLPTHHLSKRSIGHGRHGGIRWLMLFSLSESTLLSSITNALFSIYLFFSIMMDGRRMDS